MPKTICIDAGSTVFAKNLLGDILSFSELSDATISLFGIDSERLTTSEIVARKAAQTLGARSTLEATADRRASLHGADYAIGMIQVAGNGDNDDPRYFRSGSQPLSFARRDTHSS